MTLSTSANGISFTDAQQELISSEISTYTEACPGAGKTQAIIQRFIERPGADRRRGLGLISFTNAAVDEARYRCSLQPELLQVPNFVGTIDAFINRFLVGPVYLSRTGVVPTFRDSWSRVPGSAVAAAGVPLLASLDWFNFDITGVAGLSPNKAPLERRRSLRNLESWQVERLETRAAGIWSYHITRGVLDSAASRVHLASYLEDPAVRARLLYLMSGRFYEVIVDEVQDCCREDVLILELLHEAGVRLTLVGDPDQAIYGFRGASADGLGKLVATLTSGDRLNGNFRSTPAICRVVDSLRYGNQQDLPVGPNLALATPVHLLRYKKPAEVRDKLSEWMASRSLSASEVLVLAHALTRATNCAGAPAQLRPTDSKLLRLAAIVHGLQEGGLPGPDLLAGLSSLETILREMGTDEALRLSNQEHLESLGLTDRTRRELCLRLAMAISPPYAGTPAKFKAELADQIGSQVALGWSTSRMRLPKNGSWPEVPKVASGSLSYSTIHGYKGKEFPVVVLVLSEKPKDATPEEGGVELWLTQHEGEARRVLYVGASRAREVLVLAVQDSLHENVEELLRKDGVPIEVMG